MVATVTAALCKLFWVALGRLEREQRWGEPQALWFFDLQKVWRPEQLGAADSADRDNSTDAFSVRTVLPASGQGFG